jgi:hypothetical protein
MKMILNRDLHLVSLCGRSTMFREGVVTFVPPNMVKEAIAVGAVVSPDEDKAVVDATMAALASDANDAAARVPAITEAIKKVIARNQRGDFTAGGRPNLNVLAKLTGFIVTSQELEPLWNATVAEMA